MLQHAWSSQGDFSFSFPSFFHSGIWSHQIFQTLLHSADAFYKLLEFHWSKKKNPHLFIYKAVTGFENSRWFSQCLHPSSSSSSLLAPSSFPLSWKWSEWGNFSGLICPEELSWWLWDADPWGNTVHKEFPPSSGWIPTQRLMENHSHSQAQLRACTDFLKMRKVLTQQPMLQK